jgi:hypothetical protein
MDDERNTSHLDAIDDPLGIPSMLFDGFADPSEAATQFADRVQAIRWELWNLLGSLDNIVQPTSATQWAVISAIDNLGISVRAEASRLDGLDPDPADLFTDSSIRRLHRERESEREAGQRRAQMGPVAEPPDDLGD